MRSQFPQPLRRIMLQLASDLGDLFHFPATTFIAYPLVDSTTNNNEAAIRLNLYRSGSLKRRA